MAYKTLFFLVLLLHLLSANAVYATENEATIVPESISDAYSDIDMRVRLAAKPSAESCVAEACELNSQFDARVQQIGEKLAASAYVLYPTLQNRVAQFSFSVVDKKDFGTASNSAGKVVLFRGLQTLELSDDALGFIMAREMGHVIGKHHHKNASTKLIISALATVLFPAAGILGISSTATQATTATTLLTSAATTATSMLGSEVAMARMKPNQLLESDGIALTLMNQQDWDLQATADILQFDMDEISAPNSWILDLQVSDARLQAMLAADVQCSVPLENAEFSAEVEPATKIGFEDFDPSKHLGEAEQNFSPLENIPETVPEPILESAAPVEADVKIEAIQ